MIEREITQFNKTEVYTKQVEPLVNQITKICKLEGIPFFYAFATKSTDKKTFYKYEGNLTGSNNMELADDKFTDFLLLIRGAKIEPLANASFDKEASDYIINNVIDEDSGISEVGDI